MKEKKLKLLILEDNPDDAELVVETLEQEGFIVDWSRVEAEKEYLSALGEKPDLILADYSLPDFDGITALNIKKKKAKNIPFIIISGTLGEERAVKCIKSGATDYILKDKLYRLGPVVKRALDEARIQKEREDAIEALSESEKSLSEAQRIAHLGNWDWDIIKNKLKWSDEIYRIFDLSPQKFGATYEAFLSPVHPEDREYVKESVNKALNENKPYSIDHRIVMQDGKERIVHERSKVFFDNNGKAIRMVGTVQDITEQKKAENELILAYNELDRIFNTTADGMRVVDINFNVLRVNKQFCKISKLSQKENLKSKCYESFVGENCHKSTCTIKRILNGASRIEEEVEKVRSDNKKVPCIVTAAPLKKADGKIIGVVYNYKDITDRKIAKDKLKESYTKLQKTLDGTINTLASIIETRDPYTSGHQKRVSKLATAIANKLGLETDNIGEICTAALIHDIGKINIPASILSKPGKISDIEFDMIKTHPQVGYNIIKNIEFPNTIKEIVLQHHERENGSGYPNGLKGKDIVLGAKILAVVDVVEAMSSHRPYRAALGINKALEEIKRHKGKLYDTRVVDVCIKLFKKDNFSFD